MTPRAVALAAIVAACAVFAPPAAAALHLTRVGTFTKPVYVTAPPGDAHRLFVVEQAGRIMEVRDGQKLATPFLDITADVLSAGNEQGLLSMAFAPDYATSGRYYVYYTAPRAGDSTGSVIKVDEISPAGRRTVFRVDHPTNSNHNGGQLQFGPDGMLYAGTGDGGSANDPPNNAQNPSSLLGKLLRIDPVSGATSPEIYALGLRNPFRFSFDRRSGDLVIGDVGQNTYEEVDFSPAGTGAGRNYGWRCREGMHPNPTLSTPCTVPGAIDPVLEKNHSSDGFCAIIGGYVVRDPALSTLAGRYVYGDNCNSHLRSVTLPGATDDADTGLTVSGLTSFGEDSCGHVYAASGGGPVYRIDGDSFTPCPEPPGPAPTPTPVPDTQPPTLRLDARARQHVLRVHGFRVAIGSDEQCTALASGSVRIGRSRHLYVLRPTTRQIAANARVTITLRASKRALRAIRTALRHRRRVTATLTVTGRDAAGNQSTGLRRVQAIR